jgi:hypothetical protein
MDDLIVNIGNGMQLQMMVKFLGAGSTISFQRGEGSPWLNEKVRTRGARLPRRYRAGIQERTVAFSARMQPGSLTSGAPICEMHKLVKNPVLNYN